MPVPPRLPRRPIERRVHGEVFRDDFEWVRQDRDAALRYLTEENAYADAVTERLAPLRESVFAELKGRSTEDETSIAYDYLGNWYYSRTLRGRQYESFYRCPKVPGAPRPVITSEPQPGEILLRDGERIAAERGSSYYAPSTWDISPDGRRFVCLFDLTGDEQYEVRVTDVETGEILDEAVSGVAANIQFLGSGDRFLYVRNDHAWRAFELWEHRVGTPVEEDRLVLREEDERFRLDLWGDSARTTVLISSASARSTEWRFMDALAENAVPYLVLPRKEGVVYDIDMWEEGELLVVHDQDHPNGSLAIMREDGTGWRELLPGSADRRIWQVTSFRDHVTVGVTQDALETLLVFPRVRTPEGSVLGEGYVLDPGHEIYSAALGPNLEFETDRVLVRVESMTVPTTWYEADLPTGTVEVVLRKEVPGHDRTRYREWREWAVAADGARIPMSLVARADIEPDGTAPGLLHGYGAYDTTVDPDFDIERFPLLDRGVVYAIAHVRGGGEMGRSWWEDGALAHKENSFTDFLVCAQHLVTAGWVDPARLAAEGRSAGGLLVGAAVNQEPDRFAVVLAGVPFVDVVTTTLDADAPLTVGEWEEWGDPVRDPEAYRRMAAYSPYENVRPVRYPLMLVTTSLNDQRVNFVEPLKWVAELRRTTLASDDRPILLRCSMAAGHGGPAGRLDAWRESAWEWAVVLDGLGAGEVVRPQV